MRKWLRYMVLSLLLCAATAARAYDFSAVVDGRTLYFNYAQGGVVLTYPTSSVQPTQAWVGFTAPTGALDLPDSVTYGGTAYAVVAVGRFAFYGCSGLTSVTVPEGVTALRASAFRNCTSLTSVALPATLDSVYGYAFGSCAALADVAVAGTVPPSCLANVFDGMSLGSCTLHVPCGSAAVWSADAAWGQFGTVADECAGVTLSAMPNYGHRGSVGGGGTYPAGTTVTLSAMPADGFFFACWNDGDTLNPRLVTVAADCAYTAFFFALQRDTVFSHSADTVAVHDTVVVTVSVTDTVYLADTLQPTFFRLTVAASGNGVGVGNGLLPAGTVAEIGALPMEGSRFVRWDDGSADNPRTVTLTGDLVCTALFETLGLGGTEQALPWTVAADGADIVVGGVEGRTLCLYSADGRRLYTGRALQSTVRLRCSGPGAYLVSVDGGAARKVIVN